MHVDGKSIPKAKSTQCKKTLQYSIIKVDAMRQSEESGKVTVDQRRVFKSTCKVGQKVGERGGPELDG
jgi:ribosomal protein L44E